MPAITITDLENAKTDVDHLAAIANSSAPTATDRLGRIKQTIAGLSAEFPNASANAAAAAASATQAANEATSAAAAVDAAFAEATSAQAARTGAEAARDAAMLSAGVYATTAAGLAATTSGRYFSVPSSDSQEYLILYLNNAGSAVEQKRYPSAAATDAIIYGAADLFLRDENIMFSAANLLVRRYVDNTTITDYAAGYSQTAVGGGLQVSIPESGSSAAMHYLRTGITSKNAAVITENVTISTLNLAGDGVGIGFITGSGDYIVYWLSSSGVLRKTNKYTSTDISSGHTTYGSGAVIRYEVEGLALRVYVNNVLAASTAILAGEFETELLIGQRGFSTYIVNMNFHTDSIREYVEPQISDLQLQIDAIESGYVTQEQLTADTADLFRITDLELFPDANLLVRRYTGTSTFNDYAAGYSQTAVAGGLRFAIPSAGSAAIKHYAKTGRTFSGDFEAEITVESIGTTGAVGIGYLSGSGAYIGYSLSNSGVPRKHDGYGTSDLAGVVAPTYAAGAVLRYVKRGNLLEMWVNGILGYTHTLAAGEFSGELLICQIGFPVYVVNFDFTSDPIRNYVDDAVSQAAGNPDCMYSFAPTGGSSGAGQFKVYSRIDGKIYAGYEITHEVNMADLVYVDYWRITQAKAYTYNGESMTDSGVILLDQGESECVFKRNSNKDDFTGGYHGDEIAQSVSFFASGVKIDPALLSSSIPLTACSDFRYLVKSTMHATAEGGVFIAGHPIECYHTKQTSFVGGGYETKNRLAWDAAGLVTLWYHGISCIGKSTASKCYTDGAYTETTFDGSNVARLETVGDRKMYGWNSTAGYSSFVTSELLKPSALDATATLFIQDRSVDSKYYRRVSPATVAVGEVWDSVMRVEFSNRS